MEIIFATKNKGKMKEIRELMSSMDCTILSMEEAGIDKDVEENGTTFEENALKKAVEIMQICKKIVLADDSGLEIDCLNKEPGVYSARYLGEDTPYDVKNNMILEKIKDVPDSERTARFVSVIALAIPQHIMPELAERERYCTTLATVEGFISHEQKGENGFGYDPIFHIPEYNMTLAQMTLEQKNEISHRAKAMSMMKDYLQKILV